MSEAIQVVVRCRPFNKKEISEGRGNAITMDIKSNQVFIANPDEPDGPPKQFTFDSVYDENTIQRSFYEESCFGLVESVLEGFNGTIFAYGQTGCGKTWTMQGPWNPPELRGVIPNAFSHVFEFVNATKDVIFLVHCAYLEIYNEEIRDLLADQSSDTRRDLREDPSRGVFVNNLTDVVVNTESEMDAVLNRGLSNRTVGATLMNSESSRSHSIFTIIIEMNYKTQSVNGKDLIKVGKLNLVDLAGSERQKKTGASGDRLKEGSKINLSLSALGNVISALSEGKSKHIPYRDSKLTRLLQDSLGGNTKTLMVAAVSPADYNYDETLSTLRYANRAKSIKNKPKINEDPKDTLLREYREEIERLKKMLADQDTELAAARSGGGGHHHHHHQTSAPASASAPRGSEGTFSEEIYRANPNDMAEVPGAAQFSSPRETRSSVGSSPEVGGAAIAPEMGQSVEIVNLDDDVPGIVPQSPAGPPAGKSPRKAPSAGKEVVEVTREVLSEDHVNKHKALTEYSEAVVRQRDEFGDLLKQRETEVEIEKRKREELNAKLEELQSKLTGHFEGSSAQNGSMDADGIVTEAQQRHMERKAKAKKRMEAKINAEIMKTQQEKAEVESALEELKATMENVETGNRRLAKLRKKHERELEEIARDNEDMKEEFQAERDRLLETIREQTREMKLFEQICRAMASDKELRKVLEKSRWDEDNCEWVLPFVKKQEMESSLPSIGSGRSLVGTPPVASSASAKQSPRVSGVVALPSALASPQNRYTAENSPRPGPGVVTNGSGIADEEDDEEPRRRRTRSKSFKDNIESDGGQGQGQGSLTSLPVSLVPKPPKSRTGKKKGSKRRNKEKQAQEDDLTDFVTEDDNEEEAVVAGPISDWGFDQGSQERASSRQRRNKTPGLPKTGKDKSERTSPRSNPTTFESLPHL